MRSSTTRSGWSSRQHSTPGRAVGGEATVNPSLRSRVATASAIDASSSTTTMVRGRAGAGAGHVGPSVRSRSVRVVPELWRFGADRPWRPAAWVPDRTLRVGNGPLPTLGAESAHLDDVVGCERHPLADLRDVRASTATSTCTRSSSSASPSTRTATRKWSRRNVRVTTDPLTAVRRPTRHRPRRSRTASGRTAASPSEKARGDVPAEEPGDERVRRVAARPRSGVPTCSMRPACMTTSRSASANASSWSWVTNSVVSSRRTNSARSSATRRSRSARSSAPSGSSSISSRGSAREGPGEGHPLLLAAGELADAAALEAGQPDERERVGGRARLDLGPRAAAACAARTPRCPARRGGGTARGPGT